MDGKARDKALERARSLEKAGQGDAAAKLFREAGAVEESARVLGMLRRRGDLGISIGGIKTALRKRWVIVGVDQIVQRARMVR